METNDDRPITPDDARLALAQADAEEQATLNPPFPAWYFPAIAAAVFVLFALNSIDDPPPVVRVFIIIAVLAVAIGIGALVGAVSFSRPGYRRIHIRWAPTLATAGVAILFPIAALLLAGPFGSWVWIPAGAALAVIIIVLGILARRSQARA